ncbi:MAG: flagellar basal-body MS-ring/collar protein FliF [Rhodospirillales bacterium]|nr:flagellar basal-body MS-ring/collar protein FliF [Rhodospirillales bacterium]
MNGVLEGLKALGAVRLAAMAAVALAVFTLLLVLALRGGSARMGLLYGDLDLREASQMADLLEHQHIAHQLGSGGSEILVPADQVTTARVALAHDGLPSGGSVGYEIFDRGDGLLASAFTQRINQTRALEGELARTIQAIRGVRAARVHLVLPHREPFAREQQAAQASVLLTLTGAARLDREEVQAVLNLVAAAVPGLRPENIALADSRGTLLARAGQPAGPLGAAATLDEMQHSAEQRLAHAVEDMLSRSLGPGRVQAEAAIEMDLDQVHETQERFDPDGQVVRSTQTVSEQNRSTEAAATTSVQNNLPNPDAQQGSAGNADQRQEETTNYEIGKTVRSIVREHPQIRRISLAVLLDGVEERDARGVAHWRPRTAEELARITALVRGAIGYDDKRGDHVEVASMIFAHEPDAPAGSAPLFGLPLEKGDVVRLAQTALIGLVGLLALAFVLRPTVLRLTQLAGGRIAADVPALAAVGGAAGGAMLAAASGVPRLPPPDRADGREDDEVMIAVANIEGHLRASSIRRLAELVEKHPEESLTIVRTWMLQEPG